MKRRLVSCGAVLALALLSGCETLLPVARRTLPGPESAVPLAPDEWAKTTLDCSAPADPTRADAGTCRQWYALALESRGELSLDVYAPAGPGIPDFDVRLEDAEGELLWGYAPTGESPRNIRRILGAGTYFLLLESIGEQAGRVDLELFSTSREVGAPTLARPGGRKPRGASPPAPKVSGEQVWMTAEIVEVEGRGGSPAFVRIDAGAHDGLAVGFVGELVEGGVRIGVFEIVAVEPSESRGRFASAPIAAITYDTQARIRIPLQP